MHRGKGTAWFVDLGQPVSGKVEDMSQQEAGALFQESVAIMARLRAPGGCPWDREQSFATIRQYTLEETYEVLDAIEREHWADLGEELGDLLLQVLFYARMGEDAGYFSIVDVLEHLNRKLIRRHPHVFGEEASAAAGNRAEVDAASATEARHVLANWEAIKKAEKTEAKDAKRGASSSLLDEVPRSFPALLEAAKLGGKAAKVGFDWPDRGGLLEKVQEECREIKDEVASEAGPEAIEGEVGDLLFTVVNLARHLKVDPELALRRTNAKFRRRFAAMERASDRALHEQSAARLEALWEQAKQQEAVAAE
jgi:nucleoside triphosphate diphosphatase